MSPGLMGILAQKLNKISSSHHIDIDSYHTPSSPQVELYKETNMYFAEGMKSEIILTSNDFTCILCGGSTYYRAQPA